MKNGNRNLWYKLTAHINHTFWFVPYNVILIMFWPNLIHKVRSWHRNGNGNRITWWMEMETDMGRKTETETCDTNWWLMWIKHFHLFHTMQFEWCSVQILIHNVWAWYGNGDGNGNRNRNRNRTKNGNANLWYKLTAQMNHPFSFVPYNVIWIMFWPNLIS